MANKEKSLHSVENYHKTFDFENIQEYLTRYNTLIKEYVEFSNEGIYIQNMQYFKYVIERGIETLHYIYTMLLLYTKNLDITFYYCQKAYYYYIEFIGQIGDDSHSFLQLNSKDATLFVYKKTICDINNDHRKKMELTEQEEDFIDTIKTSTLIYNKLFYTTLDNHNLTLEKKKSILDATINDTTRIHNKTIFNSTDNGLYKDKIETILYFIDLLFLKDVDYFKATCIIESFVKKIQKNNISKKKIEVALYNSNFDTMIKIQNPSKIMAHIFSSN